MIIPSPRQRTAAYLIDILIIVSAVYFIGRINWMIVPDSEVPHGSMAAFTNDEFTSYIVTAAMSSLLILVYHCLLPLGPLHSTWGGYAMGIEIRKPGGAPLGWGEAGRRGVVLILKLLFVFALGPALAFAFRNTALSVVGLLTPLVVNTVICAEAQRRPDGAFLWERLGGYRYFLSDRKSRVTANPSSYLMNDGN